MTIRLAHLWVFPLLAGMILSGCTTSALRGVGAQPSGDEPVALAVAPAQPAMAQQQEGVSTVEPVALAPAVIPPAPTMAANRAEAVAQIRAKSEAMPDVKPNVFAPIPPNPDRMTADEAARTRAELAAAVERNRALAGTSSASARAEEARRLRARAQNHYKDALKQIQN